MFWGRLQTVSEYRKSILSGAILAVIIASGLAAAAIWVSPNAARPGTDLIANSRGPQAQVILELTDPPVVPAGTTSLNLTYSEIDVLVAEQGVKGAQTISILPKGGEATLDLFALRNVSRTIASASVPNGSEILSATFIVSKITIDINGLISPVTLATGGNDLVVVPSAPLSAMGMSAVLLELNPTITSSDSGFQLIPSSAGIIKPQSELSQNERTVGSLISLSSEDRKDLNLSHGKLSASLVALTVEGTHTTMSIQVTNMGTNPARLILFGIQGEFVSTCPGNCRIVDLNEMIFIPGEPQTTTVTQTTTVSGCAPRHMSLVNGPDVKNDLINPIIMNPGQCLTFTFSGEILIGNHILVPSTEPGQKYHVRVLATGGAETRLDCNLPISSSSCSEDTNGN